MKKVLALILAMMMVMTMFAACGGSNDASNANNANAGNSSGNNSANDSGSGNSDDASGESAGVIKVGTSGPLTGGYAVYGVAVANGLELAFEEINAMGGLQFAVRAEDDEAGVDTAVNAYNALMDWGMQIMAGPTTSGSAAAAAAECAADGVFMMTPSASDAAVLSYGDNVFQICFSDPNQGKASADYIFNNSLAEKVGVIYDSSSAYSTGIYQTFKAQAEVIGLNIETVESFTEDNKADLTTQVTKCKEAGCDLLFLPLYTAENAQVLTCMNKIGFNVKVFSCDGMDGILSQEGFDPTLAEGVMLLTPFDATATDDKTKNFVENYTAKFGIAPNQFAADAYDVGYAIYEACTAMGVTADMSAEEICEAMITWFTTNSFDGITGAGMTWGADGAVSKYPMAVIIEDGVYVTP